MTQEASAGLASVWSSYSAPPRNGFLSSSGDVFQAFKSSEEVKERFVRAYELMLGFYGIQLQDRDTGAVCRAQNYHSRFQNLNW